MRSGADRPGGYAGGNDLDQPVWAQICHQNSAFDKTDVFTAGVFSAAPSRKGPGVYGSAGKRTGPDGHAIHTDTADNGRIVS